MKSPGSRFIATPLSFFLALSSLAWPFQDSPARELGKTRSMAEMQHEIVMLLIQKKEYDKAVSEASKIFDMKWPEDQEPTLLKELLLLSDRLLRDGQPALGLRLLEMNERFLRSKASQVAILKEKGYLYKKLNQADKALECFRQAQEMEKRLP